MRTYEWKPKLTPAKLRALRLVVECKDPAGYKAKGVILTSCHPLFVMGLIDDVGDSLYRPRFKATEAGKRALNRPARYKPVGACSSGGIQRHNDHIQAMRAREP